MHRRRPRTVDWGLDQEFIRNIDLKSHRWQSLTTLHRPLLHEHHDFSLASQHPSAGPLPSRISAKYSMPARMWRHGIHACIMISFWHHGITLRVRFRHRLAAKYSMPARMWRHGIHAFFEISRYRLPRSLEYMLTFIYTLYSIMALMYGTTTTSDDILAHINIS